MKKFLVSAMLIIFLSVCTAQAQEVWRLDGTAENALPRNFRLMTDAWHEMNVTDGVRAGLSELNASASGQPSHGGLRKIYEEIRRHTGATVYIVDLREESHGFADDYPVSWYIDKNRGNYYRGYEKEVEYNQIKSLQGKLTEFLPLGNYDKAHYQAVTFTPQKVSTEQNAVDEFHAELISPYLEGKYFAQIRYVRFPATDMMFPAPQVVDDFLKFVGSMPQNAWLHFHCQAGHGRTTTFLVFYDILKNPELSLEDICKRQYYLGGSNLLEEGNVDKIKLFYQYAHSDRKISWSEYWQKNS